MIAFAALVLLFQSSPPGWQESPSDRGPVLSFGPLANAPLSMRCVRPSIIRVDLGGLHTGEGREPRRVRAQSGRTSASYPLVFGDNGFTAEIPVSARVMQAFGQSGRLRITAAGAELTGEAAGPSEVQVVAAYLQRCAR